MDCQLTRPHFLKTERAGRHYPTMGNLLAYWLSSVSNTFKLAPVVNRRPPPALCHPCFIDLVGFFPHRLLMRSRRVSRRLNSIVVRGREAGRLPVRRKIKALYLYLVGWWEYAQCALTKQPALCRRGPMGR